MTAQSETRDTVERPTELPPAMESALRVINNCLAGRARQISRVLTARFDEEMRPVGITVNQLTILSAVAVLEEVTLTDLRPYMQMELSTLSRNVARMIDNRWLATIPGKDKRSYTLLVAPEGFRVLERVAPHWERAHEWARGYLADEEAVRSLAHRVNPLVPR